MNPDPRSELDRAREEYELAMAVERDAKDALEQARTEANRAQIAYLQARRKGTP